MGKGRGQQEEAKPIRRDLGGAKHENGRNGQNDKRHGRERSGLAGATKKLKWNRTNKQYGSQFKSARNLDKKSARVRDELATGVLKVDTTF
ncbi:hypothetical protein TNCV_4976621 [Trichonephila clavipes]|nr:hypothetical protein TNCV_4976621 [Trichonephila clavipes]